MSRMSGNDKSSSRYFGDILKLTNQILDSGETCHMAPQVSDFYTSFIRRYGLIN